MDPVYAKGYEPENRRYLSHYDFLQANKTMIISMYVGFTIFFFIMIFAIKSW